jgi:hypothetical protein
MKTQIRHLVADALYPTKAYSLPWLLEAVDEMETARAASACAGRETTGEQRFGRRPKGARLFMPHMDPIDLATVDDVGDLIHRVADDPVARLHAGCLQRFDQ